MLISRCSKMRSVPFSFSALESRREKRIPKPVMVYKPFSTPVGACDVVANHTQDYLHKAMFDRHPQKCIAEKRNVTKFATLAGAV